MMRWKNGMVAVAVGLMLCSFGLWSTRLDDPYIGPHDNHTAWVLLAAQNYAHYGLLAHGLEQYIDAERTTPTPANLYHNHPPLISLWVTGAITLWGESEAATRLSVMLVSLLTAAAVFALGRKMFNPLVGLLALFLFLTSPVVAFYGQMVAHEQFILLFFGLALLVYVDALRQPTRWRFVGLAALSGLTVFAGWGGYLCVGVLGLHSVLFQRKGGVWAALGLGALIGSLAWMLPAAAQGNGFFDTMTERFLLRSGQTDVPWDNALDYGWTMLWARLRPRYTEALLLAMGVGGVMLLVRAWRTRDAVRAQAVLALLLLLPQLLYMILLRESAYRHDYTVYYLALGAALLGAYFVAAALRQAEQSGAGMRWGVRGILLLFLIGHLISSGRWTYTLYTQLDDFPVVAGQAIAERASEETVVYANVGWWPALWYYAGHNVQPLADYPTTNDDDSLRLDCQRRRTDDQADTTATPTRLITAQWSCALIAGAES